MNPRAMIRISWTKRTKYVSKGILWYFKRLFSGKIGRLIIAIVVYSSFKSNIPKLIIKFKSFDNLIIYRHDTSEGYYAFYAYSDWYNNIIL